jgi:hypothetical protein
MRPAIQLFELLLRPLARRHQQALAKPQVAQAAVQRTICQHLMASEYGKSLGIHAIADWSRVPIVTYDDLTPWIQPEPGGQPDATGLTPEPILFYERTSGSSGPCKWIPYTRSLRRSFSHLFCLWAQDLIHHGPKFTTGQVYACISPQLGSDASLQDDTDYLEGWLQGLLHPFLVSPKGLSQIRDPQIFQRELCLALLRAEQLETISIWSPSFLQAQLRNIHAQRASLLEALRHQIGRERWQILAAPHLDFAQLWPHLKLISCWDRINAADSAQTLRHQFPGVMVQGKGLLATEAPLTWPSIAAQGYLPLLEHIFFEFADTQGNLYPLHELSLGQDYTLILSQTGGLYRYLIGDRVRVSHWYKETPCLEFLGRSAAVSDLVGEKLTEAFVQTVMTQLALVGVGFKSLVPVLPHPDQPAHYVLLLDRLPMSNAAHLSPHQLAHQLEQCLADSYHYRQARQLGQLSAAQVRISPDLPELITQSHTQTGAVWGGVKHPLLATVPLAADLWQQIQTLTGDRHETTGTVAID